MTSSQSLYNKAGYTFFFLFFHELKKNLEGLADPNQM